MTTGPLIRLADIGKRFDEGGHERLVFRNTSLEVARGEWLFLVGRSGSGKSTLLNLISGIDLPDSGTIEVDGVAVSRLGERERTLFRRHRIGFVFQFYNLIPTLTVRENILLPLELTGALTTEARRWAVELLERIGLGDRADSYPDRLSGGEQQRVAVARALVHRPLLVLADEPTGNLDRDTGMLVLDLLTSLLKPVGTTLVLVTHSQEVARHADRILTIADGRVSPAEPLR